MSPLAHDRHLTLFSSAHVAIWSIAAVSVLGVIVRPWALPEALWASLGAAALVLGSLLPAAAAWQAVLKGADVYLFLVGMMLLAEMARHEGLFDWLAALAVRRSQGSATRLFVTVYAVGTIVTVFLSNDATAVVLTPAVYAAAQRAGAKPLPYLFVCAFIANAASFVLPISNPANLVVYGSRLPTLEVWLRQFGVASLASVAVTLLVLWLTQRGELRARVARDVSQPPLSRGGRLAAGGIAVTALLLLIASSRDWQLGLPTFIAGAATAVFILALQRASPVPILRDISWSVLPLVAGLFVLVDGLESTGVLAPVAQDLAQRAAQAPAMTALLSGSAVALLCNLVNNLPLGLMAGAVGTAGHLSAPMTGALLIGVDLGPNLSVTGSLATLLWLVALRRESQEVSAWRFLGLGALVMPPALLAALAVYIALNLS